MALEIPVDRIFSIFVIELIFSCAYLVPMFRTKFDIEINSWLDSNWCLMFLQILLCLILTGAAMILARLIARRLMHNIQPLQVIHSYLRVGALKHPRKIRLNTVMDGIDSIKTSCTCWPSRYLDLFDGGSLELGSVLVKPQEAMELTKGCCSFWRFDSSIGNFCVLRLGSTSPKEATTLLTQRSHESAPKRPNGSYAITTTVE